MFNHRTAKLQVNRLNRRQFIATLSGLAATGCISEAKSLGAHAALRSKTPSRDFSVVDQSPLKVKAREKGLFYGSSVHRDVWLPSAYSEAVIRECGAIVSEGTLKWAATRPTVDEFDFSLSDRLLQFAQQNNMLYRGHTLLGRSSYPAWFQEQVNTSNAEEVMLNHISTVVKHYSGKIHSWDVVNEAISTEEGRRDGLRYSSWLQLLGPDYIQLAFRTAHENDPNAILVYNDFGIEAGGAKPEAVYNLLQKLKTSGAPVHALGIQAHLSTHRNSFRADKLQDLIKSVARLGLKVYITELDVFDTVDGTVLERDKVVASVYEDFLTSVLQEPAVLGVMTWGLSDRYTWLTTQRQRADGAPPRPLPLDESMNRKLAWNAIYRAFDSTFSRNHV
jgi:endo-1,4-beta-xylanase